MNPLHFYCVFCGSGIEADSEDEANMYECAKCRRLTPVPAVAGVRPLSWAKIYPPGVFSVEVKFPCPACGGRLGMDARNAGDMGICPICHKEFQCPQISFLTAPGPGPAPAPKEEGMRAVVHLSREEIDFLNQVEFTPERPVLRAS